jgi:formyltetrahydrofolate deformylase
MDHHILLIECKDEKDLIHKITGVLFLSNINIISNAEFVDRGSNRFFMHSELLGSLDEEKILNATKEILPEGAEVRLVKKSEQRCCNSCNKRTPLLKRSIDKKLL